MNPNFLTQKNATKFICESCDFKCSKQSDWNRHIMTAKHKKLINPNNFTPKNAESLFSCDCGKVYKHMSSLCAHKKKCSGESLYIDGINIKDKDALVLHLLKQNGELQNKLIELSKEKSITNNNTNNTNSHNTTNNAFNLNFFLNETCKNAMNISDFVSSIKLNIEDLENTGRQGYIEGISNIIVKNLKALDITKRPVHCTDKKRETVYIKDEDKWEKDEDKSQMHKLIKKVAFKNVNMFAKFKEEHPDCMKYHSKYNDQYQKIVYESMGGKGDNDFEKNEKIIKNVLKEVVVDKNI